MNRSAQQEDVNGTDACGPFGGAPADTTDASNRTPHELNGSNESNEPANPAGRRAWWCFWGALALVSAALDSQPGLSGSSLRGDPMVQLAYLDPGAGSFVIQALVAALAGIAVTTKVYWHRIMGFFGRATPSDDDDDDETRDHHNND